MEGACEDCANDERICAEEWQKTRFFAPSAKIAWWV